jgi:hypothetical protein
MFCLLTIEVMNIILPPMKKIIAIAAFCIAGVLAGCAGADHAFQGNPYGKSSSYLLGKFGYPSEVKPSVMGAETWVYKTGGRSGSWEYTIKDKTIVSANYISHGDY